eukprot:3829044-Pyramimonas_sp.AAC.1
MVVPTLLVESTSRKKHAGAEGEENEHAGAYGSGTEVEEEKDKQGNLDGGLRLPSVCSVVLFSPIPSLSPSAFIYFFSQPLHRFVHVTDRVTSRNALHWCSVCSLVPARIVNARHRVPS